MNFFEFLLPLITQILRINSKSVNRKDAKDAKKRKDFLEFPRDWTERTDYAGLEQERMQLAVNIKQLAIKSKSGYN